MVERGEGGASRRPRRRRTCAIVPARKTSPGFAHETSDGALKAAGSEVEMAPFSAPFGGFCPRLGSLCKGRVRRRFAVGFRGGLLPVLARWTGRSFAPAPGGKVLPFPEKRHPGGRYRRRPPVPASLCAAQARPARRSGMKPRDRSDAPPFPPCRRRETIFRRPPGRRPTSFLHPKHRPRLAATPCGVSAAG